MALLARDLDELDRAREELQGRGAEVLTVGCDLTSRAQISAAVHKVARHFGRIDVLINNAGIIEVGPLEHTQREDFERAMDLHFWAPFHLIMEALPHLRRRRESRVVNISSIGGKIAVPHLAAYCASKFALAGLSDSLRAELARDNIHVTTVCPGMMRTGSHVNAKFKGDHEAEYAWFAASTAVPLAALKAERAAAQILLACARGQPSLLIPFSTKLATIGAALFPNLTGAAMKIVNKLLPSPAGPAGDELRTGWQSRSKSPGWLTHSADLAITRNNESGGRRH